VVDGARLESESGYCGKAPICCINPIIRAARIPWRFVHWTGGRCWGPEPRSSCPWAVLPWMRRGVVDGAAWRRCSAARSLQRSMNSPLTRSVGLTRSTLARLVRPADPAGPA